MCHASSSVGEIVGKGRRALAGRGDTWVVHMWEVNWELHSYLNKQRGGIHSGSNGRRELRCLNHVVL